jgi:hypothetical protein
VALRLLKPAYDGDRLSVPLTQTGDQTYRVDRYNAAEVLLAQVSVELPSMLPPVDPRAQIAGAKVGATRVEIDWNAIEVDVPFASVAWTPSVEENRKYADQLSDDLPVYRAGVVHPHLIQHWCNQMLVRRFILPGGSPAGTEMTFRRILKVGDATDVRAIPIEKWERKGYEFIKLYLAFLVDGAPAVEAVHTAIYKAAPKAADADPRRAHLCRASACSPRMKVRCCRRSSMRAATRALRVSSSATTAIPVRCDAPATLRAHCASVVGHTSRYRRAGSRDQRHTRAGRRRSGSAGRLHGAPRPVTSRTSRIDDQHALRCCRRRRQRLPGRRVHDAAIANGDTEAAPRCIGDRRLRQRPDHCATARP